VLGESTHQFAADAATPMLWQHPGGEERTAAEMRRRGDAAAGERPLARREQKQAPRLVSGDQLLGRDRVIRDDAAFQLRPRLEVGRRRNDSQLDHPDLLSLPCCFA